MTHKINEWVYKNMHIVSTNFAETLVWKHESGVKLWCHKQRTPNANDHHMPLNETPHETFLCTPLISQASLLRRAQTTD